MTNPMTGLRAVRLWGVWRRRTYAVALCVSVLTAFSERGHASPAVSLTALEVKQKLAHRLDGFHFTAKIRFDIQQVGFQERRELVVWRDDKDRERERLMAQFRAPADMRGVGLLYVEGGDTPNDYFIYQPSQRRVRRIPESLVSQDVYGVDLEYMGFGVAQLQPVEVVSMEVEHIDGRDLYRLTEQATYADLQRFDRRVVWVDPETFLIVRTEHFRDGKKTLIAKTIRTEVIDGIPTPTETIYERPREGTVVTLTVDDVDYHSPIPEIFFSTLQLTKAE
jgi:hypothetical protein